MLRTSAGVRASVNPNLGSAIYFDGTSKNIEASTDLSGFKITTSLTIGCWVYCLSNTGQFQLLINKTNYSNNRRQYWLVLNQTTGLPSFQTSSNGSGSVGINGKTPIAITSGLNKWRFVVGKYNSTTPSMSIYVDGLQEGYTTASVSSSLYNGVEPIKIGSDANSVS